jgi:hypothetical protein
MTALVRGLGFIPDAGSSSLQQVLEVVAEFDAPPPTDRHPDESVTSARISTDKHPGRRTTVE